MEKDIAKFSELNTQVLGCSVDTHFTNNMYALSVGGLSYPLLGDIKKEVAEKFGVLRPDGLSDRASFIVGKDGKLKWKKVNEISKQRENEEILAELKKLS
ncbi:MAG: hypothetical protein A2W23_08770 [Planctomycetes bacterium RBG_16_43_13]|nr:MAG: hypothetical protein A2W23_08770 [Planctomycetes bacterium RBG_16_43_13]